MVDQPHLPRVVANTRQLTVPNRAVDDRDCGAHEQALWLIALDRGDHFLIGHVTAAGHQQNRDAMTTASANRPTKVRSCSVSQFSWMMRIRSSVARKRPVDVFVTFRSRADR